MAGKESGQNGLVSIEEKRAYAIAVYQRCQMPVQDIADTFGVSRQTVYNWLNSAGVVGDRRAGETNEMLALANQLHELLANQERMIDALRDLQAVNSRLLGIAEGYLAAQQRPLPNIGDS